MIKIKYVFILYKYIPFNGKKFTYINTEQAVWQTVYRRNDVTDRQGKSVQREEKKLTNGHRGISYENHTNKYTNGKKVRKFAKFQNNALRKEDDI